MPKYLLLRYYRGGPEPHRRVPRMDHWAPEDVEAHGACAAARRRRRPDRRTSRTSGGIVTTTTRRPDEYRQTRHRHP